MWQSKHGRNYAKVRVDGGLVQEKNFKKDTIDMYLLFVVILTVRVQDSSYGRTDGREPTLVWYSIEGVIEGERYFTQFTSESTESVC